MASFEHIEIKEGVDQKLWTRFERLVAPISTAGKLILRWSTLQKALIQISLSYKR